MKKKKKFGGSRGGVGENMVWIFIEEHCEIQISV